MLRVLACGLLVAAAAGAGWHLARTHHHQQQPAHALDRGVTVDDGFEDARARAVAALDVERAHVDQLRNVIALSRYAHRRTPAPRPVKPWPTRRELGR